MLDPDCRLGHLELDEDHERILGVWTMGSALPAEDRAPVWEAMRALFVRHFRLEDELMERCRFPGLRIHRTEHDSLLSWMDGICCQGREISVPDRDFLQLKGWMRAHLQGADRELVTFLLERDVWELRESCQWDHIDQRLEDLGV